MARDWFAKAAFIWIDMERGVYDWGEQKPPKHADGSYRVVKKQVLADCNIAENYGDAGWHKSDEFQKLLNDERFRRDNAITSAVALVEDATGPLLAARTNMHEQVLAIFQRTPDSEDPTALSPDQYQKGALAWTRYIDEQIGRSASQEEHGVAAILAQATEDKRITNEMMQTAVDMLKLHRTMQDERLSQAGLVIDGEIEE